MTTAEARRLFGSNYAIAKIVNVNRSTVGRWGRMVPEAFRPVLEERAAVTPPPSPKQLRRSAQARGLRK